MRTCANAVIPRYVISIRKDALMVFLLLRYATESIAQHLTKLAIYKKIFGCSFLIFTPRGRMTHAKPKKIKNRIAHKYVTNSGSLAKEPRWCH